MAQIRLAQSASADLEKRGYDARPFTRDMPMAICRWRYADDDMPMTISAGLFNRGGDQHRRVNCASHSLAEVFPSLWHIV